MLSQSSWLRSYCVKSARLTLFGFKLRSSIGAPVLRRETAGEITRSVSHNRNDRRRALDADFGTTTIRGRVYLETRAVGCPFRMTMMKDSISTLVKDRATFA